MRHADTSQHRTSGPPPQGNRNVSGLSFLRAGRCTRAGLLSLLIGLCPIKACAESVAPIPLNLTPDELAYIARSDRVTLCVDPDWAPFERLNEAGRHEGIGADLVRLVAERVKLRIDVVPVKTWDESLEASKAGRCQLMSFLNRTPAREAWLTFTAPLFTDPNVLITREEHPPIDDVRTLRNVSIALPRGTMVEERIRNDFPNLRVILTDSERDALAWVSNRRADMTMRSLIVAAHTIKTEGWFNLKIAGQIPEYTNALRIGVLKDELTLRDILDKGVMSISQQERDEIVNRHVSINIHNKVDYTLLWRLLAIAGALLAAVLYWSHTRRALERARAQLAEQRAAQDREARQEQSRLMAMLSHEIRTPLAIIDASAQSLQLLVGSDDPACNQRIARIRHGVSRLTTLGSQLLAKDRLDDEGLKLRPAPIDARTLCRDLLVQVDTESRVQIQCDGECTLDADPALLEVALRNLLVNALRYSPEGSAVPFDIRSDADTMRFRIANAGPGIDPAVRSQLFTTYLRGQHKNPSSGAGLGLYLVKRVVELHGGHIHLSPETEPGVSFTVVLPRHQDGTIPCSSET